MIYPLSIVVLINTKSSLSYLMPIDQENKIISTRNRKLDPSDAEDQIYYFEPIRKINLCLL